MDDNEGIEIIDEEVVEEIPPTPWHNSDTVAVSFKFASELAAAASEHFRMLGLLALGQSAHEWLELDKKEFIEDSIESILGLPEGGEDNG